MDVEFARHSGLDLVEELTEFGSTVDLPRLALADGSSGRNVESGEQRCGAMSSVVMLRFGPAGRDASAAWWLRSSARIGTSHPRIERHRAPAARRIGHDVAHFGHEVWIVESLKASVRCGWSPKTRQIRCTVDTDRPLAFAMPRELRWMAFSGQLSNVLTITASMRASSTVRGARSAARRAAVHAPLHKTPPPTAYRRPVKAQLGRRKLASHVPRRNSTAA
ncbi:hypothetical protein ACVWXO_001196 [Bradyrhizobium sp. LM2.7]